MKHKKLEMLTNFDLAFSGTASALYHIPVLVIVYIKVFSYSRVELCHVLDNVISIYSVQDRAQFRVAFFLLDSEICYKNIEFYY